ncbi:DNA mismatch repair protein Msh1p, mitochondrial [Trichomonascus vanleenenianus]|uniref:mismatch repair ATPase MSH1 n=1 Tax=Trichomonascus vanleenenianus TaxID=2268995 RepID=UPI003ECA01CE
MRRLLLRALRGTTVPRIGSRWFCPSRRYLATTVEKIQFDALGIQPLETCVPPVDEPRHSVKRTPLYQSISDTIAQHPGSVVLTQVGSFFELYFEQAVEWGPKMNIKLAKKRAQDDQGFIYMAGFPCYQLDRYLKILVSDLNQTVVIVEQFENDAGKISRQVSRIVTPGTLISESFIDRNHSNYLAAIVFTNAHLEKLPTDESPVALAYLDLSLGDFYYEETTLKDLSSDLARISPSEILLDSSIRKYAVEDGDWYPALAELKKYFLSYHPFPGRELYSRYASVFEDMESAVAEYQADNTGAKELSAITGILSYVSDSLPGLDIMCKAPQKHVSDRHMKMDKSALDALEVFQSVGGDSVRGSVFNTIRRTVTPSGTRALSNWLSEPLTNTSEINKRQDLVEFFFRRPTICGELRDNLKYIDDFVRIAQKVGLRRIEPIDLLSLANSVQGLERSIILLSMEMSAAPAALKEVITALVQNIKGPLKLAKKIDKCLDADEILSRQTDESEEAEAAEEKPKVKKKEPNDGMGEKRIMKETASTALQRLYEEYRSFDASKAELQAKLASYHKPGISIKLKWSPMYLYHVHVMLPNTHRTVTFDDVHVDGAILNQTKNRQCIQNNEWTELGTSRESLIERKKALEYKLLQKLREEVVKRNSELRICGDLMDCLDITSSFATLAKERNLVRPQLVDNNILEITNGRHMTVEASLGQKGFAFTSNDCKLEGATNHAMWIITGPNMGGKSTFIRQTALICILAQIGCYVPADSVKMGVVDRIFCRVGAADDLYRDRSTFMVEMLETSSILQNATSRSLAIMDEVGRGTSSRDGLALSYASIVHLHEVNKCRTLFATHFGAELHDLLDKQQKTGLFQYYHADLTNMDAASGKFVFDYKMKQGICRDSQGLRIAALAGFPSEALEIAKSVRERGAESLD